MTCANFKLLSFTVWEEFLGQADRHVQIYMYFLFYIFDFEINIVNDSYLIYYNTYGFVCNFIIVNLI